jgi:hypothetical protein
MNFLSIQYAPLYSAISIRFSLCFDQEAGTGSKEFIVHSVNACESPDMFRRKLDHLVKALLEQIHEQAVNMDKAQCTLYIDEAIERLQALRTVVCFDHQMALSQCKRHCWMFHHPSFDCEQKQTLPGFALNAVLRMTAFDARFINSATKRQLY